MVNEICKAFRYEKIENSVIQNVHAIADAIRENTKEDNDDIIYEYACQKFINAINTITDDKDIAWVFEIIICEHFDYCPKGKNPYIVKKQ